MDSATPAKTSGLAHPSGDNRFKLLDAAMKRHRYAPEALIEILHTAQELFGFLQADLLYTIAQGLKLPPSQVYGVATFYHFFTFRPKGEHTCTVCTGTACYVKGADALLAAVVQQTRDSPGLGVFAGASGVKPHGTLDGERVLDEALAFGVLGEDCVGLWP